ncbi:signal peptidase II [Candidatus Steffania adelgidicola]|uniref:signal peptidase II n=1 Tax=Candidatus Steffania adelgidicola TaxID=1076626 RepID=UPI001D019DF4|nr:signal peptidase II [Candidatus Steffania adelgidicola]UDG79913.1 Lipoprotein signal peptidase [Candidatus Steffania adelgidicola]
MKKRIMSTGLPCLWLTLVVLALDLGSKQWIMANFSYGESVPIFSYLNFTYTLNPGAAFSFLANKGGGQRFAFSAIAVVSVVMLVGAMYRSDKWARVSNTAYAMIIGGALGNLHDRIVHGVVIDFIDFNVRNWHWPIFNIADAGICIGALLIVINSFQHPHD